MTSRNSGAALFGPKIPRADGSGRVLVRGDLPHTSVQREGLTDPTLAIGLSTIRDYRPGLPLLNLFETARPWLAGGPGVSYNNPESFPNTTPGTIRDPQVFDAAGWIKALPAGANRALTLWQFAEAVANVAGTYRFEYEGEGTFTWSGGVTVISSAPGRQLLRLNGAQLDFEITNPDSAGNGNYLRNMSLVRTDRTTEYDAGAIFNPQWLELIKDMRQLRFMDWTQTNNSQMGNWAERARPRGGPINKGQPLEYLVALCNQIGADLYYCVPHRADLDWSHKTATYIAENLRPGLQCIMEFSNETWNWAFQHAHELSDQAKAYWDTEDAEAFRDWHGRNTTIHGLTFKEAFATAGRAGDCIVTFGTQAIDTSQTIRSIQYCPLWRQDPDYVDPLSVIDAVSIVSYFGGAEMDSSHSDAMGGLLAAIRDRGVDEYAYLTERYQDPSYTFSVPSSVAIMRDHSNLIRRYKNTITAQPLRCLSYEGGQHAFHSFAVQIPKEDKDELIDFMTVWVESADMAMLYGLLWDAFETSDIFDGPFMQFGDTYRTNQYGAFGIFSGLDTVSLRGQELLKRNAVSSNWWGGRSGPQYQHDLSVIETVPDTVD